MITNERFIKYDPPNLEGRSTKQGKGKSVKYGFCEKDQGSPVYHE